MGHRRPRPGSPPCAVIVVPWLAMRLCGLVQRVLRDSGVELLTRISRLLLSAIAVQLAAGPGRAGRS